MKPDIIAPGANITSCLSPTPHSCEAEKNNTIAPHYTQLSGTSMSTPIVTGAIALLLQKNPCIIPDEIKLLLKSSATNLQYPQNQQGCT